MQQLHNSPVISSMCLGLTRKIDWLSSECRADPAEDGVVGSSSPS